VDEKQTALLFIRSANKVSGIADIYEAIGGRKHFRPLPLSKNIEELAEWERALPAFSPEISDFRGRTCSSTQST